GRLGRARLRVKTLIGPHAEVALPPSRSQHHRADDRDQHERRSDGHLRSFFLWRQKRDVQSIEFTMAITFNRCGLLPRKVVKMCLLRSSLHLTKGGEVNYQSP